MKRRTFLKSVLSSGMAMSGYLFESPLRLALNEARAANPSATLIVIFQRGGCDGLNTVVPFGDDAYYALRPTIGIARPDSSDPDRALDLDGFFGLHPSLSALLPIYLAGDLAILPSVQYPDPSRSHFRGQYFIESGQPLSESDGWLNRYLAGTYSAAAMRAVHFGDSLSQALRGQVPVSTLSSLERFNLGLDSVEEDRLIESVSPVYEQAPAHASANRELVLQSGRRLFGDLELAHSIDVAGYQPTNGALYPDNQFGLQLREIAQLIKTPGVDLEVATVDSGGWDTHSGQGGGEPDGWQSRRLADFSAGIRALYDDLAAQRDRVMILTMTEFGRTAHENGSRGTDHGIASSWFLIGGAVNGGIHNGDLGWPGLSEQKLLAGRFLNFTVDYRDIFSEILLKHFGATALDTLVPGHGFIDQGLIG